MPSVAELLEAERVARQALIDAMWALSGTSPRCCPRHLKQLVAERQQRYSAARQAAAAYRRTAGPCGGAEGLEDEYQDALAWARRHLGIARRARREGDIALAHRCITAAARNTRFAKIITMGARL